MNTEPMTALTLLAYACMFSAAASVCCIPLFDWAERRFGMDGEL